MTDALSIGHLREMALRNTISSPVGQTISLPRPWRMRCFFLPYGANASFDFALGKFDGFGRSTIELDPNPPPVVAFLLSIEWINSKTRQRMEIVTQINGTEDPKDPWFKKEF